MSVIPGEPWSSLLDHGEGRGPRTFDVAEAGRKSGFLSLTKIKRSLILARRE
jgi:hypothetical protein